jgi:predicted 2-oxoglutarate/Fe(II)-dependent dioxygenase YbiX
MFIPPKPIEATKTYAGVIAEFESIWGNCDKVIKGLEKEEKQLSPNCQFLDATERDVRTLKPITTGSRTNKHKNITAVGDVNEFYRQLNNSFYETVYAATLWYAEKFHLPDLHHVEPYNLLRYQTGQEYKAHFDGGLADNRVVSPILYLNDNYKGGELEFVHYGITIKPKAGSLYLFPSNYPYSHIAHPVTEGTKYAIVTWLHGRLT